LPNKTIVLLADGTGNSAAKLFKTNVWRLYRALDQSDPPPAGERRQIAYYHDGVGTSTFKPLALLGGIFGIGLKRNVLEIYAFLCRNYEPGDRIYVYGFSRGAFTVRVLAGLVVTQGVLRCATEQDLKRYAADAYRNYRRRYKLPIFGYKDKTARADPTQRVGLVDLLRDLRDGVLKVWRWAWRSKQYGEIARLEDLNIDFIGVWDTVAAYGLPIDELTRGIDEWVWPLSMPNYRLSEHVLRARHALSLDDERDTFHPLLWDELEEVPTAPGAVPRLQQVWFAGVHSNVGGGYADDTASYVPLRWMMDESAKPVRTGERVGLRFLPAHLQEIPIVLNDCAPLSDSRRGVGAYYRYQPRKIVAKLDPPDPSTLMMQDPDRKGKGFLRRVQVHESVFHRIASGNDRYAPIVLPPDYDVVTADGTVTAKSELPPPAPQRPGRQEWVFDDVWRRRVNYFTTVGVSALLVLLPVLQAIRPPSTCTGPQCLLAPVITSVGAVLPGFVQSWITAFAATPGIFLFLVFIIFLLMARSWTLKRRSEDGMRELWAQAFNLPLGAQRPETKAGMSSSAPDTWIYRLRTRRSYQRFFQWLKWRALPGVFGFAVLVGGLLLILALVLVAVQRTRLVLAERSGALCTAATTRPQPAHQRFVTYDPCWRSGIEVEKGHRYRITLLVTQEWVDKTVRTSPLGFESDRFPWYARPVVLLRRSLNGRWFEPMVKIVPAGRRGGHTQLLEMSCACGSGPVYTAEFTARRSGEVVLAVNDAAIGLFSGPTRWFYDNNQGEAEMRIELLDVKQ
jgi:uncharacterized protein (DUF2235 family)